jgi:two-component system, sensor histidine kinase SagS
MAPGASFAMSPRAKGAVAESTSTPESPQLGADISAAKSAKVLCLAGAVDTQRLKAQFGEQVEVVSVNSTSRALAQLARGEYIGVYADAQHFAPTDAGRLMQNERVLQGMPDGVALLAADNSILWANGRLREWTKRKDLVGANFYQVLGGPDILGPDFCPFHSALTTLKPSATSLRCDDNRYYRIHAAPIIEESGPPQNLVVTVRDVTEEELQRQKLDAIHQAGVQLADLTTDEVANLNFDERVRLLKDNILHSTQEILQFDVVEIRMLDQSTNVLEPLLAVGIKPESESRVLRGEPLGNGVTGYVAATGKSYLCEDTSEDPLFIEGAQGARSSLTVPIKLHEQVIGTFNVESPEANHFTESDRQFLEIFCRDLAVSLNTLELLAAEKATTAAASIEAIHSAVALPMDDILIDAVNVMERYIGHEPDVVERIQRILRNARDIKQVIQKIGQTMAPAEARPMCVRVEQRPLLVGKRILVVDADDTVRGAAHTLLERYHCTVESAHDGNEAVFMVRNLGHGQKYDAIISDIRLPDFSGYQLLLRLKELMKVDLPPLILMTGFGYDPGHSIVNARQAGLKWILYKPFRLDQLIESVEKIISDGP